MVRPIANTAWYSPGSLLTTCTQPFIKLANKIAGMAIGIFNYLLSFLWSGEKNEDSFKASQVQQGSLRRLQQPPPLLMVEEEGSDVELVCEETDSRSTGRDEKVDISSEDESDGDFPLPKLRVLTRKRDTLSSNGTLPPSLIQLEDECKEVEEASIEKISKLAAKLQAKRNPKSENLSVNGASGVGLGEYEKALFVVKEACQSLWGVIEKEDSVTKDLLNVIHSRGIIASTGDSKQISLSHFFGAQDLFVNFEDEADGIVQKESLEALREHLTNDLESANMIGAVLLEGNLSANPKAYLVLLRFNPERRECDYHVFSPYKTNRLGASFNTFKTAAEFVNYFSEGNYSALTFIKKEDLDTY